MSGGISWHALNSACGIYKALNLCIIFHCRSEATAFFYCGVNSNMKIVRYQFCNGVHLIIRHTHYPADITNCGSGLQGTESDYLCHMVCSVLFGNIVDYLLPPFVTEVYIKVGHRHSLGIQKTLKDKVVFHRVDIGYTYAISGNRACARASAGTYGNIPALCKINKVPYDKIVIRVAHFIHGFEFVIKSFYIRFGRIFAVAFFHSLKAFHFEILKVVHIIRGCKIRKFRITELKIKVTHIGNLGGVFHSLGNIEEKRKHFFLTL